MNSRSRFWLLTLKADGLTSDYVADNLGLLTDVYAFQKEAGTETGYEHYQIALYKKDKLYFTQIKTVFPTAFIKNGDQGVFAYAVKEETRIDGPWTKGTPDSQGKRSDVEQIRDAIVHDQVPLHDLLKRYPAASRYMSYIQALIHEEEKARLGSILRPLKVVYLSGQTRSGKTRTVYDVFGFEDTYRVSSYKNPWDSYDGQSTLVLDEYHGQLPLSFLLNVLDPYPQELPARFRNRFAAWDKVIVVSNKPLVKQYSDLKLEDRPTWDAFYARFDPMLILELNTEKDRLSVKQKLQEL